MSKLKKAWMVLAFGLAAGASFSTYAAPDPRTCYKLIVACNDGDFNACVYGKRIGCDM
ncbi:hypothetical protein [Pseudoduganella sp.]|uniref:hypothetical protein n=1 Tax=Pseudoduganella sp. TaxID=1880898 RepID=UPI0035AF40DF